MGFNEEDFKMLTDAPYNLQPLSSQKTNSVDLIQRDEEESDKEQCQQEQDGSLILKFSNEILVLFFGKLSELEDHLNLRLVCKRFYNVASISTCKRKITVKIPRQPPVSQESDDHLAVTIRDFNHLRGIATQSTLLEYLNIFFLGSQDLELQIYVHEILIDIFKSCKKLKTLIYNPMVYPHTLSFNETQLMMHPVDAFEKLIEASTLTFKELNLEGSSNLKEKLILKSRKTLTKLTLHHTTLTPSLVKTINSCPNLETVRLTKTIKSEGDFIKEDIRLKVPNLVLSSTSDAFFSVRRELFSLTEEEEYILLSKHLREITLSMDCSISTIINTIASCKNLIKATIQFGINHTYYNFHEFFGILDSHSRIEYLILSFSCNPSNEFISSIKTLVPRNFISFHSFNLANRVELHLSYDNSKQHS